ncbi:MAG: hypothetical protein ABH803_00760 [Candidatus Micrarchaeota archaeon]
MNKQTFLKWFTVALILIFVLSSFSVLLYSDSGNSNNNEEATPSVAPSFSASQSADGVLVTNLTNYFLGLCNTTGSISSELKSINGTSGVISLGSGIASFYFNGSDYLELKNLFYSCSGEFYQSALLDFTKELSFKSGEYSLSFPSSNLKNVPGFVFPSHALNDSISVDAVLTVTEGQATGLKVFETNPIVIEGGYSLPLNSTEG